MNRTVFKRGTIWMNVGEVAIQSGIFDTSVYHSALLGFATLRQRVHLSRFESV